VSFSILLRQRHARGLLRAERPSPGLARPSRLFEYEGTNLSDLALYYKNAGQTEPFVPTGHIRRRNFHDFGATTSNKRWTWGRRWEWPGLTMVYNYVGSTDTAILSGDGRERGRSNIEANRLFVGLDSRRQHPCPYFTQMGTQDQNFFAASGDSGYWHAERAIQRLGRRTMPLVVGVGRHGLDDLRRSRALGNGTVLVR